MPGLVSPRQFGTEAYSIGRLPVQQTQLGSFNLRTPDSGKTPTEDPTENPTDSGNSKGISGSSTAGAGAGAAAGAGAKAGAKTGSKSFMQTLEEPLSGVSQGLGNFERSAARKVGQSIWDVTSPSSAVGHVVSNVMNFGNPFPAGSPGGAPVNSQQFGKVGESTAKSAVGEPEGGFSGFVQTAESAGSKVGSALADVADALF